MINSIQNPHIQLEKKINNIIGGKQSSKKCSKGKIMRESYIKKSGIKVNYGCIEARSASGKKTSDELKKYIKKKEQMHKLARHKFPNEASKSCKSDQIKRDGYYIKAHKGHSKLGEKISIKGHWVSPGCINSPLKRSSKGSKLITLMEKDVLKPFGYSKVENISVTDRRSALKKAIKVIKPLSIYRRIIAIATLNENKNKKLFDILRADADWIKTQPEYLANKVSKKSSKKISKKSSKKISKKISKKSSKKIFRKS